MARRPVQAVADDFVKLTVWLKKRKIIDDKPSDELLGIARRIHRATYSLILWRFRLRGIPEHGMAFIEEIASDSLQILPQVLMGYEKTGKLLGRGILENTLRHVYFSDHPVEYRRMNDDKKWYLPFTELVQYAASHPDIAMVEDRFDSVNRINSLYSELSGAVHGRTVRDLEMRASLGGISFNAVAATAQMNLIELTCTHFSSRYRLTL